MNKLEETFVDGVKELNRNEMDTPLEILNWYRNLYYKEHNDSEHIMMACAINTLFEELDALSMLSSIVILEGYKMEDVEEYNRILKKVEKMKGEINNVN